MKKKKNIISYLQYLYPILLFLYPLRHIRVGAEWNDTGYNYANFTYMDRMDEMWMFSTYLGNGVGSLLSRLPFGDTMIGMNVYTGLFVSVLALAGYLFFVKLVKLPAWVAFAGEFLAISLCWCPTALLYNYLTYLLMGAGYLLLYQALMTEGRKRNLCFVLAGAVLGINVFARFSNLSHMALIVAVWAMGIIRREKFVNVVRQTLWCILGYASGLGLIFGWICLHYGAGTYVEAVLRLLRMPAEASSYTIMSMVTSQIQNYLQNVIWLGYFAAFVLVSMVVYACFPKRFQWIAKVGYAGSLVLFYYFMRNQNMYNLDYITIMSAFQWAVFFLTATMSVGLVVIFGRKFTQQEKLLCGMNMIIIVITPLGSNNHLYASINNLFFVAPFTLWMIWRFIKWLPEEIVFCRKEHSGSEKKLSTQNGSKSGSKNCSKFGSKIRGLLHPGMYPVKAMCYGILVMIFLQSTLFGWCFVFHESNGGENLHTKIENSDILKGMLTSPDRAEALSTICTYVKENELAGKEVILYGDIPSLSYYLEMPFAITAWPDLPSYNYEIMVQDLQELENRVASGVQELPVILLEVKQAGYLREGLEALEKLGASEKEKKKITEDPKLQLLNEWIQTYEYKSTFENAKFVLLQSDG